MTAASTRLPMTSRLACVTASIGAVIVLGAGAPLAGQPSAGQPSGPRPPAASLSRPVSPSKAPAAAGFIQRWLVLEPSRVPPQLTESAVRAAIGKSGLAEAATAVPRHGDTVPADGGALAWHAVDTRGYNVNLFHFAYALNKPTSNVLFWAVTVIDAPREIPGVRLAIGSNAASIWWLNGEEVITLFNDRQAVIDDGVSKRVTLRKGANVVRAAVINAGGATDFCARIIDEDGQPVTRFTVTLDPGAVAR
jgi:hypothetical protein